MTAPQLCGTCGDRRRCHTPEGCLDCDTCPGYTPTGRARYGQPLPRVSVTPGEIRVGAVDVLMDRTTVFILEVDCDSKHPLVQVWRDGDPDAPPVIHLTGGAGTLRIDDSLCGVPTEIALPEHTKGWYALTDFRGRYTVWIVAVHPNSRKRKQIWPPLSPRRPSKAPAQEKESAT